MSNNPQTQNSQVDPATTATGYAYPKEALPEQQIMQSNMEQYFTQVMDQLGNDYFQRVMNLAKSGDDFLISVQQFDPTGKKVKNPVTEEEEPVVLGWKQEKFTRRKISAKDFKMIDRARADYNTARKPQEVTELMAKMYEQIAYKYLNMDHDTFVRCDWDELRPVLDACNFRTVYSLPFAPKTSST